MERGKRQALSSFFGGAGFYIALLLCVVATGVGGYFALFGGEKAEETSGDSPVTNQVISPQEPVIQVQPGGKEENSDPEETVQTSKPVVVAVPEATEDPEPVQPQAAAHVVSPLNGEITAVFSMRQWSSPTPTAMRPPMPAWRKPWRWRPGMPLSPARRSGRWATPA